MDCRYGYVRGIRCCSGWKDGTGEKGLCEGSNLLRYGQFGNTFKQPQTFRGGGVVTDLSFIDHQL